MESDTSLSVGQIFIQSFLSQTKIIIPSFSPMLKTARSNILELFAKTRYTLPLNAKCKRGLLERTTHERDAS